MNVTQNYNQKMKELKRTYQIYPFPTHYRNSFCDTSELFPAFNERALFKLPYTNLFFCDFHLVDVKFWPLKSFKYLKIIIRFTFRAFVIILNTILLEKCQNTFGSNSYFSLLFFSFFVLGLFFPLIINKLSANTARKHEMSGLLHLRDS